MMKNYTKKEKEKEKQRKWAKSIVYFLNKLMMKRQCWDLFRMFTIFCLIGVGLVCSTHLISYSLPLTPLFCVYVQLNVTRKFNLLILVHREVQINNWLHAVIACECAMRWMLFSRNKKKPDRERKRPRGCHATWQGTIRFTIMTASVFVSCTFLLSTDIPQILN